MEPTKTVGLSSINESWEATEGVPLMTSKFLGATATTHNFSGGGTMSTTAGGGTFLTEVGLHQRKTYRQALRMPGPDDISVNADRRPLPSFIHLPTINDAILKMAPFAQESGDQRFWWTQIASDEYQALLEDAFWFALAHVVQKTAAERIDPRDGLLHLDKSPHFQRISRCYVDMLKRVPNERLVTFKHHYEEVLAFTLILCFQAAFPTQPEQFRSADFARKILDLCMEWVRGFRPATTRLSSGPKASGAWIFKSLVGVHGFDLSGRNLNMARFLLAEERRASEQQAGVGGGGGGGGARPRYAPLILRRVRYKLQHSPLIHTYLSIQDEKDQPHLGCRITWTEEPAAPMRSMVSDARELKDIRLRQAAKTRTVPNIRQEVKASLEARQAICDEHARTLQQHRREVARIRNGEFAYTSSRPITREMEALVAAGDLHEISNYLVQHAMQQQQLRLQQVQQKQQHLYPAARGQTSSNNKLHSSSSSHNRRAES